MRRSRLAFEANHLTLDASSRNSTMKEKEEELTTKGKE